MQKLLGVLLCLTLGILLSSCIEKAKSAELTSNTTSSNQRTQFTFDTDKYWKIYISLAKEEKGTLHPVDAIVESEDSVTVLYPGDRKSVTYPIKEVRSVMFFHRQNKTGSIHIFNQ